MTNPETYNRVVTIGVDIQNDFALPTGALSVPDGEAIVAPFNAVAEWTRTNGGQVALTADQHPTETEHFKKWPVHCVAGTEGADLHKDVQTDLWDRFIVKGTSTVDDGYSGFEGADTNGKTLEAMIRPTDDHERVAVLIGGLATDYCVEATVLDALEVAREYLPVYPRRIGVFVVEDAIRAVNINPEDGERAIAKMKLKGAHFVTAQEVTQNGMIQVEA